MTISRTVRAGTLAAVAVATLAGTGRLAAEAAAPRLVVTDFEERQIYHSPQTPGWTAWVTLWKLRGGDVMTSFVQATGDVKAEPNYNFVNRQHDQRILRSKDGGKTWEPVVTLPLSNEPLPNGWVYNGGGFTTVRQLSDGSLLAARWGRDWVPHQPNNGLLFSSTDEGKTWSGPRVVNDPTEVSAYPTRLRQLKDGTLMLAYQGGKIGYPESGPWVHAGVFVSHDLGKTWEGPDFVAPNDDGLIAYPEPAFVEFPDGNLLFMFRIEIFPDGDESKYHPGNRRVCLVKKKRGHWVNGPIRQTPVPHAGHPELLLTRDGIVVYFADNGHWASADQGLTWSKLELPAHKYALYYPQAVELDDGRILVAGHVGADNPFPPPQDMSICGHWFRVRKETAQK